MCVCVCVCVCVCLCVCVCVCACVCTCVHRMCKHLSKSFVHLCILELNKTDVGVDDETAARAQHPLCLPVEILDGVEPVRSCRSQNQLSTSDFNRKFVEVCDSGKDNVCEENLLLKIWFFLGSVILFSTSWQMLHQLKVVQPEAISHTRMTVCRWHSPSPSLFGSDWRHTRSRGQNTPPGGGCCFLCRSRHPQRG